MSAIVNSGFESLFFGTGAWLGLLIFMVLIIGVATKLKYAGALCLPICVFMFIQYNNNNLPWQGIVILLTGIYSVFKLHT